MSRWDTETRSSLAALDISESTKAHELLSFAYNMLDRQHPTDIPLLISALIKGTCSFHDHLYHELRAVIDQIAVQEGIFRPGGTIFYGPLGIAPEILSVIPPDLWSALHVIESGADCERITLLEPSPNEIADNSVPAPMNMLLHRPIRPAVSAFASSDATVYADPFRYQILSRSLQKRWASGSPKILSRISIGGPDIVVPNVDNVVVLQDRFRFTNFSHFLFDGITRALLLAERMGDLRSCLLLFGGILGEYQEVVCRALTEVTNVPHENIFFPDRPIILKPRQRCIWFSDQVDSYMHPAQMAHPQSIKLLRTIADETPGKRRAARRIYISRADAHQRRLLNESDLSLQLKRRGFETLQLSKLSIPDQIGAFRWAEIIVAPHAMGLTHVAMSQEARGVVELFPPGRGTDAYAFISRAGNIPYYFVLGSKAEGAVSDFEVSIQQTLWYVDQIAASSTRPNWAKPANLLTGTRSFAGFEPGEGCAPTETAVAEMITGHAVLSHCAANQIEERPIVVGRWTGISVIPGLRYTASCWVSVPERFSGGEVSLVLTGCSSSRARPAGLRFRDFDQWQRIHCTAVARTDRCDVELHLSANARGTIFTTCWQLERGDSPTAYIGT
jgi:Glycosyltransferase 61